MSKNKNSKQLSLNGLRRLMDEKRPFYLVDVLGDEHFRLVHLPGAFNACVYEVTFIDQVKAITEDKNDLIVVYGSGSKSMDSITAAEKLLHKDYINVLVFKGGIEAWREAGLRLEGSSADKYTDPGTFLKVEKKNRTYPVNKEKSIINWTGRSPSSIHTGSVNISDGEITVRNGKVTGRFDIDMTSIKNFDLEGDNLQPVLISHLKSDDFFLTKLFPKATFKILEAVPVDLPYLSVPNFKIKGILSLRGVKASQNFMAIANEIPSGGITAEAHFDIDRTRWGVIYGSSRFFEHLGMHLVFDFISIQVRIITEHRIFLKSLS